MRLFNQCCSFYWIDKMSVIRDVKRWTLVSKATLNWIHFGLRGH